MRLHAILAAALFSAAIAVTPTVAAETKAFDASSFAAAQAAEKPIVVEITAPWCPTCRAQKPVIEQLTGQPQYQDLVLFQVDFDSQKDAVRALGANMQSTLIAYRGKSETARSVGITDPAQIARLFDTAIRQ